MITWSILVLLAQATASPPVTMPLSDMPPARDQLLGVVPGGQWACSPEHEAWRAADTALLRTEMAKGAPAAAADLPALEAALGHAPPAPVGGTAVCDGRTVAFSQGAALAALTLAAGRSKTAAPAGPPPPPPFTVDARPMPYPLLALLVGSIDNSAGRSAAALAALDRGLVVEPQNAQLVGEKAFTLVRIGRSQEAADACARAIAARPPAPPQDLARLHRTRGYALGELGRYDEALAEYRSSQALDPAETTSANEITYLEGRKAGRGPSPVKAFTSDQGRKPPG